MKRVLIALIFTFASVWFLMANASPIPMPQVKNTPESLGFALSLHKSMWSKTAVTNAEVDLIATYRSSKPVQGVYSTLTIRFDKIPKSSKAAGNIQKYVDGWIKEYPRLGYEVQDNHLITQPTQAMQLDLSSMFRRVRQTIFVKDDLALIFTCSTHPEAFEKEFKGCEEIVKAFHWL